jgi:preprotein translocase YajC subunit
LNRLLALLAPLAAAGPETPPAPPIDRPWWVGLFDSPFTFLLLMLVVFYFFLIRNKRRQENQRKQMIDQLKRGDRVQTIGGILGTVIEARENEVLIKVDESSNTKIRFARSAIHRVLDEEKPQSK